MLGGVRLKVIFTHEKTCFAYINIKYSTNKEQTQCIQVLCRDRTVYLWVVFSAGVSEGQIALNPVHCRLLGLEEDSDVFVSPYSDVKVLDNLYVDTDSPDDQEILEHNAELLQTRILDQLRLVVAHQKAVVWISSSMPIVFTPKQTGILINQSQIIVKIDAFNSYQGLQNTSDNVPKHKDAMFKSIAIINDGMLRPYLNIPKKLILRAIPVDSDGKKNFIHPYTVFIHEDLVEEKYRDAMVILATMRNMPVLHENRDEDESANNNNHIEDLCVEIVPINNVVFRSLCREVYNKNIPTVLIPKSLNTIINVDNGSRIILTFIGDKVDQPEHIDVVTYSDQVQSEMDVIERFKNCVITNTHSGKKFLINNNMLKQNTEISSGHLQFKLKPERLKYTMLNSESFRDCSVSARCLSDAELVLPKTIISTNLDYDYKNYCRTMKSIELLVEKVISHIYFEIHREASFKGVSEIKSNVLVTGLSGSGKSSLCHMVQKELTVWSQTVQCRALRGRKDVPEVLGRVLGAGRARSPAVLVLDDVDALVPHNMEGLSPQDIAYYQRLATVIKTMLQSCGGVCVLMTSLSTQTLHPTLRHFNGKPLFTAQFTLPEMEQEERIELFKHLLNDKIREQLTVEDDDVTRLAMDTAGHSVREISDYLNKKIFNAVKKRKSHPEEPKPRLVEDVTKDTEKARGFDVWGPVGGLREVKQALEEAIFWPLMYPALFPSAACGVLLYGPPGTGKSHLGSCLARAAGLRLVTVKGPELLSKYIGQSEAAVRDVFDKFVYIILYGPPGTGKSHLGSCLARAAGLRLVTVKGPELLSKYIGQSEAAVRDVFDKADMQRPCILFFDEFDSLAPKRGHDSTGVTDRVVNQLLARMDGAEGGARGPVLCATSRPDLLDPALLRAGRLQTHLYTRLPDKDERLEVLQTLTTSVSVSSEVDLHQLAADTEGFTPADLKSLLVTAQLGRLEKQLESSSQPLERVVVEAADVDAALLETRPSLSPQQRLFYDTIYKRFRGETLTPEQRLIANQEQRQRVTLA